MNESVKEFLLTNNIERSTYVWNTVGSILNAFQSVFFLVILTRTIGLLEAGIFSIAYADANLFLNIGRYGVRNFQVSDYNMHFTFAQYEKSRRITTEIMGIVSIVYVILISSVNGYSVHKFFIVLGMCIWKMIDSWEDVYHGHLQQRGRLDVASKMLVIRVISMELVWAVLLLLTDSQVIAIMGSIVFSAFVTIALIKVVSFMNFDNQVFFQRKNVIDIRACIPLLKMTFPLFISSILAFYIINAPRFAIDSQLTDELQACYGFIAMPVFIISLLNSFFFNPIIEKMAMFWSNHDKKKFLGQLTKQMLIVSFITILCCFVGGSVGISILSYLYNTNLAPYGSELLIILVGGGLFCISGVFQTMLTIIRFQKYMMLAYIFVACLAFMFSSTIVGQYSIYGAVILYLLLMGILCILFLSFFIYGMIRNRDCF